MIWLKLTLGYLIYDNSHEKMSKQFKKKEIEQLDIENKFTGHPVSIPLQQSCWDPPIGPPSLLCIYTYGGNMNWGD